MSDNIRKEINKTIRLEDILSNVEEVSDVTADLLKSCNTYYNFGLIEEQKKYRQKLITDLYTAALNGRNVFCSDDTRSYFITVEYLHELEKYFQTRGFKCEVVEDEYGTGYLTISW